MKMTVAEIAALCGGRLEGDGSAVVTAFYTDSRETQPGKMFVPIRGERTDAHHFIPQVFAAGAAATFSEVLLEDPAGPVVYVADSRAALQKVAACYRERFSIPVIGITGSVGKTTTKEMVALAVSAGLRTMKTAGNANSQIGLPMTVLRIAPEDEAAVVEMGVSMPGEMARIARVAKPTVAVITNIGVSHIEFMKTRENILAEKFRIADYLPAGGTVFVNGDDDLLGALESTPEKQIVRFGLGENCAWRAVELDADAYGTRFVCLHDGRRTPVYVPAAGEHNVRNALAALAVADAVGVPQEAAAHAVAQYEPPAMRQQIREAGGVTLIDDTYNASPDSMRASLKILSDLKVSGKRYAGARRHARARRLRGAGAPLDRRVCGGVRRGLCGRRRPACEIHRRGLRAVRRVVCVERGGRGVPENTGPSGRRSALQGLAQHAHGRDHPGARAG